jgi:hypothetical protein
MSEPLIFRQANNHLNERTMDRWTTYFFERFNPILSLIVIIGIATSCAIIGRTPLSPDPFIASCLVWFFLALLFRMRNDLADYDRDRVAHPERPLPRGLIHRNNLQIVISGIQYVLCFVFAGLFIFFGAWSRLFLFVTGGYLWLIHQNFYLGKRLDQKPLLKSVLFQGIVIPMTLLSISFSNSWQLFSIKNLSYCLLLYGAFFTYDICRKLNPASHPASQTLVHFFGYKVVFRIALAGLAVSALGAYGYGIPQFLIPVEVGVAVALILLFKNPARYTLARQAASLSLIIHAWAVLFEWM